MVRSKLSLNTDLKRKLNTVYSIPNKWGGFLSSKNSLYRAFKAKYPNTRITQNVVQMYLNSQPVFTRNRNFRTHFRTQRVITGGLFELHQADLADMKKYSSQNEGVNFLLVIEDVFSKFIWVRALKTKKATDVLAALKDIYGSYDNFPINFSTDKGTEFKNSKIKEFFQKNDVNFFSSEGNTKAQFAERTIRTLKHLIFQYMGLHQTRKYIDILPNIVYDYNHTLKRKIGMTPAEVNTQNMKQVFYHQYEPSIQEIISDQILSSEKEFQDSIIKTGDKVRIQMQLGAFQKRYSNTFSSEIFKVKKVLRTKPLKFKLTDMQNKQIQGSFYLNELQKVSGKGTVEIEKILGRQIRNGVPYVQVKWKYYPNKFNSYIPLSDVVYL